MRPTFRALTTNEVQERSYGLVSRDAFPAPIDWRLSRKTLFDQAIFGSEESWTCACGKSSGVAYQEAICLVCGVKIGDAGTYRRSRFGHIRMSIPIVHPLDQSSLIDVLPVIPIAYRTDREEPDLDYLYTEFIRANLRSDPTAKLEVETALKRLLFNEWSESPMRYRGDVLRSLMYYGFDAEKRRLEDVGTYLFAMGLTVDLTASVS